MLRLATIFPLLSLVPIAGAQLLVNHARHGTATQSTTDFGGVAERAVDGSTEGTYTAGSVTHTMNVAGSWWEVDLGALRDVDEIVVHNRADCCGDRLSNFRVSLLLAGAAVASQDYYTSGGGVPAGGSESLVLPPASFGDAVRVELLGPNSQGNWILSLAEVEVLGPGHGLANLAPLGVAAQSSTGSGGTADRGNDGWINGLWSKGSVTHTDPNDTNSWWEVDLGSAYLLSEVALFNRGDCCWSRLSNFRVSTFLGTTETWGGDYFVGAGNVAQHDKLVIPLPAGTYGDRVHVELLGKNNDGTGVLSLSEVVVLGGKIGTVYCTSLPSSIGHGATLGISGNEGVGQNELTLVAGLVPPGETAIGFYGADAAALPAGDGTLCVGPGAVGFYLRLPVPAVAGPDGVALFPVDLTSPPSQAGLITAGSTWRFQVWFTDGAGAAGYNFSEAVEITFQ